VASSLALAIRAFWELAISLVVTSASLKLVEAVSEALVGDRSLV